MVENWPIYPFEEVTFANGTGGRMIEGLTIVDRVPTAREACREGSGSNSVGYTIPCQCWETCGPAVKRGVIRRTAIYQNLDRKDSFSTNINRTSGHSSSMIL